MAQLKRLLVLEEQKPALALRTRRSSYPERVESNSLVSGRAIW
jgi:hypothetical protein